MQTREILPLIALVLATVVLGQEPEKTEPAAVPAPPVPGLKPATRPPRFPAAAGNAAPAAAPGARADVPGLAAAAAPGAVVEVNPDEPITTRIEHPQADGNLVAKLYKEYTGRRVIVSSAAAAMSISFIQDPPLTKGQAAELLIKQALLEGMVFVPAGPRVDKLVLATGGVNPKNIGVPLYIDAAMLPDGDGVVSYVMLLNYIKPDEAVRTFTQVVGQFGAYGSIAAVPNASAIVITENSQLIRSLIALQDKIDVPSAQISTRFVKVEYADVNELAETLNEILGNQQGQQRSAGVQRAPQPQRNLPAAIQTAASAAGGGSAGEETPIQIVAEGRTNRLFVMGRPIDVVFVEGLIREFDTPTDKRNYLRRKLKFLSVSEFLPIANDALARTLSPDQQGAAGGRVSGGGSSRANNSAQNTRSTANRSSNTSGGRDSGFSGGGAAAGSMLSDPDVSSAPESLLIGRTLLVADNISNSIIVQGPPQSLEVITLLLDEIDVKAEQVMISTVFGQLQLDDNLEYGIDWLQTVDRVLAGTDADGSPIWGPSPFDSTPVGGQNRTTGTDPLVDPFSLLTPGAFPNAAGLGIYGKLSRNLYGYLQALESTGNFKVMSRPTIFTTNNQRGVISSGERIAVPTNSYQGGVSTGISTNIEYRDVVLSLEVIPLVNSADEVTLTIALLNDDVIGEQLIAGVGLVPTIGTRELVTTVTVPNGATVVLGGLITVTDQDSVSGIPILMSIPGLGKLFSTTKKTQERQELLIFIQPTIVNDDRTMISANEDMNSRYDSAPAILELGAGSGVLPERDSVPVKSGRRVSAPQEYDVPAAIPVEKASSGRNLGRPNSMFRRRR